ncbi:MAG: sulfotransferase family 2 domain-containing protein [Marinoscillum sp.]
MLVSEDHQFIYIKSRKTASTSLEKYLKPYCQNGIIQEKKAHLEAKEIREIVGTEKWSKYLKICAIRNPWDKMVSFYFWRRRLRLWNKFIYRVNKNWGNYNIAHEVDFNQFIVDFDQTHLDLDILLLDGKWPEDFLFIRYEHLLEDLEKVCQKIGIPFEPEKLRKLKGSFRPKGHYRKYYNDVSREIVRKAYEEDIERMGYTF